MLKEKLSLVPNKPGCYLMKNEDGNIISHQDFHILGINLEKMPSNVKFYYDPNAYGSVFTYDNIPPSALEYNPEY